MRLRMPFVSTPRDVEVLAQTGRAERAIEAAPAFTRGDCEHVPFLPQSRDHLGDACKKCRTPITQQKVVTIAFDDRLIVTGGDTGQHMRQSVVEPETDHIACVALTRHRMAQIATCALERGSNAGR